MRDQLGRRRLSEVHDQILALHVSEVGECFEEWLRAGTADPQYANSMRFRGGLGGGHDGSRHRAGATKDKRPPRHHSTTWSARASSDGGMMTPSAFAVPTFNVRAKRLGSSIGSSLGFAPFKILPT